MKYVLMGRELGGRPNREFNDEEGHVLPCREENPAGCHRPLLVGRVLGQRGTAVDHIRGDGRIQSEAELIQEETGDNGQLSLFDQAATPLWKSIPSVSPKKRQNSFSQP